MFPISRDRLLFLLTGLALSGALVFGGASARHGYASTAIAQLACLPALGLGLFATLKDGTGPKARPALLILTAAFSLPLFYLIPLPPTVWTALPGRSGFADLYRMSAIPTPWLPVSLDPHATLRSWTALIPAAAAALGVLHLAWPERRRLAWLIVILAGLNASLGLAQAVVGEGGLRPYTFTNQGDPVGFFANRNHFATLLFAAVPVLGALASGAVERRSRKTELRRAGQALLLMLLLAALASSGSRAGMLLAFPAMVGALSITAAGTRWGRTGFAATVLIAASIGILLLLAHLGPDAGLPADPERRTVALSTLGAATEFQPLGAGYGTFPSAYQLHEQPGLLPSAWVNHAHNDWLELWLEGGWPFLVAAAAFLVWLGFSCARLCRADPLHPLDERAMQGAGALLVILLMAHSTVDYPMRTSALLAVFGFACAVLVPPPLRAQRRAES